MKLKNTNKDGSKQYECVDCGKKVTIPEELDVKPLCRRCEGDAIMVSTLSY